MSSKENVEAVKNRLREYLEELAISNMHSEAPGASSTWPGQTQTREHIWRLIPSSISSTFGSTKLSKLVFGSNQLIEVIYKQAIASVQRDPL